MAHCHRDSLQNLYDIQLGIFKSVSVFVYFFPCFLDGHLNSVVCVARFLVRSVTVYGT